MPDSADRPDTAKRSGEVEAPPAAGLIVLGMHRSGTSALTGALRLSGAWLGEPAELTDPNHENPKGFWERRDLRSICDKLLHSAGADWWKIAAFEQSAIPHGVLADQGALFRDAVAEMSAHGTWAVKEPRLCLLFAYLRSFVPNPVCIHIYRNPVEVAQSLRVRNGFSLADGHSLWEIYNRNALLASAGLKRTLIAYEDLVAKPEETLARLLAELENLGVHGLAMPPPEALAEFLSPDLRHQAANSAETPAFLLPSQRELWDLFESGKVLETGETGAMANAVRQQLRDLETRRATMYELQKKARRFDNAAKASDAEAKKLAAELGERVARVGRLEKQVAELGERATRSEEDAAAQQARANKAEENLALRTAEVAELGAKLGTEEVRAADLQAKVEAGETVIRERGNELRKLAGRKKTLEQEKRALEAQLAAVYASHSWRLMAPLRAVSRLARACYRGLRNVTRLLGWLLTGQFGRAGRALALGYRTYVPHRVRSLVPVRLRRMLAAPSPDATGTRPGTHTGDQPGGTRKDPAEAPVLRPGIAATQFGQMLAKITAHTAPQGFAAAFRQSDEQLEQMSARLARLPDRPLVSIVMPTYNRADTIGVAIATVVEQRYPNWELLVCDDDSTDATDAMLAQYHDSRIRYLKLPKKGAAAARNAGLAQAGGEIITYLDSDNFWHPEFLNAVVLGFLENEGVSAVYTDYIDFRVDASGRTTRANSRQAAFDHERLLQKPYIDLNSFAHRRELYANFGGFDERLKRRQDYDLILKYTWLRDPLHIPCLTTLYQRNDSLIQITREQRADRSCISIIDESVSNYLEHGLPAASDPPVRSVTILSWDLCRNHFSKAFALAEALSAEYDVQLVSFRFFEEAIFPPLEGVQAPFETLYLPGGPFPEFFESMEKALAAIRGDVIYAIKPRLPSLGLALLANYRHGTPLVLEINDLETVVASPGRSSSHADATFEATDPASADLLNPYSDLWSELMHPLALQVPVVTTHNQAINEIFARRGLYMRNFKDERVYDPAAYDRDAERSELGFAADDRVILFGGLIRKHKGIYELVELVERLDDPHYKLLFVGSRTTPDQKKLIDRYGDRVRVLPPQGRDAMARINLAADLVILWLDPDVPASHYQMPYKASDALAMGPAVIANDISDLGVLGAQGYLETVPFGDWEAMTAAIRRLFDEPERSTERRAASRRLFLRQFSYAAARAGFRLAAQRALAQGTARLPVAQEFAAHFNRWYRKVSNANRDLVLPEPPVPAGASASQLIAPGHGEAAEDESIVVLATDDLAALRHGDGTSVAVILPAIDASKALATARLLVKRAGMPVRVFVVHDRTRQGFVRTLNDTARRLAVDYIVYAAEDALPGVDWLKRAHDALERSGKGLLAFNDGKWHGRIAGFGMVRSEWIESIYDSAVFYPGYRSHKADNELSVIARVLDEYVYEPTATLVELDPTKVIEAGEAPEDRDQTPDRQLFYERFHTGFGGLLKWQDVAALKDEYLNRRQLRTGAQASDAPDASAILQLDAAALDGMPDWPACEIAVVMPCIDLGRARDTARLLVRRAGVAATYFVVEDSERQGFIRTLNALAARARAKYIVYLAEDAFPGADWLRIAFERLDQSGKGLLAFNCGKWQGRVAAFGMVRTDWVRPLYGPGVVLNPAYEAHKADNELTVIARLTGQFVYEPASVLIENDPAKVFVENRPEDKATFHRRFLTGFDGLVDPVEARALAAEYFVPLPADAEPVPVAAPAGNGSTDSPGAAAMSAANDGIAVPPESCFTCLRAEVLEAEKSSLTTSTSLPATLAGDLRSAADAALGRGSYTVTAKTTLPPSGDSRDYWHPAPYWWPNPESGDGLPYVRRDGERVPGTRMHEPDSDKYDRSRLQRVFDDSLVLALAATLFDDERCAHAGVRILEEFFVDPRSGMHPHLQYAQVRMGHDGYRGAPSGLIETKDLYFYLDAVRLLQQAGVLPEATFTAFRRWLADFLDWLLNSPQGKTECQATNNHGTCYDLQVGAIATFLGESRVVYETLARAQSRLATQFGPDGRQPEELRRKSVRHYCSFNLQSWINLAELSSRWGMDLWAYRAPSGASLKNAARWLLSPDNDLWRSPDIESFDTDRLLPIRFAAAEQLGEPEPVVRDLYGAKPLFHPHDGIRPFWNLASFAAAGQDAVRSTSTNAADVRRKAGDQRSSPSPGA